MGRPAPSSGGGACGGGGRTALTRPLRTPSLRSRAPRASHPRPAPPPPPGGASAAAHWLRRLHDEPPAPCAGATSRRPAGHASVRRRPSASPPASDSLSGVPPLRLPSPAGQRARADPTAAPSAVPEASLCFVLEPL